MAKIYWRTIKRGTRRFLDVPEHLRDAVKALAKEDVVNRVINKETYKKYIGEEYTTDEVAEA